MAAEARVEHSRNAPYLATQVRQATRVAKADFFFRSIDGTVDFNLRIADNETMSELFWKAIESLALFSVEQERRSRHLLSGLFRQGERLYYAWQAELIREETFRSHLSPIARLSRTPGGSKWLKEWDPGLDPRFLRLIEAFQLPNGVAGYGDQTAARRRRPGREDIT